MPRKPRVLKANLPAVPDADAETDRVRLSELVLAKKTQAQIVAETGWPMARVQRMIKDLRQEWAEARVLNTDALVAEEIAKLDVIERGLFDQWRNDKSLWVVDRLLQISDRRAKLQGLNAPEKIDLVAKVMAMTVNTDLPYSPQQIIAEAEAIVKASGHRER